MNQLEYREIEKQLKAKRAALAIGGRELRVSKKTVKGGLMASGQFKQISEHELLQVLSAMQVILNHDEQVMNTIMESNVGMRSFRETVLWFDSCVNRVDWKQLDDEGMGQYVQSIDLFEKVFDVCSTSVHMNNETSQKFLDELNGLLEKYNMLS